MCHQCWRIHIVTQTSKLVPSSCFVVPSLVSHWHYKKKRRAESTQTNSTDYRWAPKTWKHATLTIIPLHPTASAPSLMCVYLLCMYGYVLCTRNFAEMSRPGSHFPGVSASSCVGLHRESAVCVCVYFNSHKWTHKTRIPQRSPIYCALDVHTQVVAILP